jgi:hypothetical protein
MYYEVTQVSNILSLFLVVLQGVFLRSKFFYNYPVIPITEVELLFFVLCK